MLGSATGLDDADWRGAHERGMCVRATKCVELASWESSTSVRVCWAPALSWPLEGIAETPRVLADHFSMTVLRCLVLPLSDNLIVSHIAVDDVSGVNGVRFRFWPVRAS